MNTKYQQYRSASAPLPEKTWAWNLYGAGVENIGRDNKPEQFAIPEPADDQLLVRIDSVGMCFSDVKIINQGGDHPKLYNRDLTKEPGRLGHEVSLTIIKVGADLQEKYHPGQRLAVQPDIYQQGKSTAYGYTIPGGLIQYHLIGPEVLDTDAGACLLPLEGEISYAAASLLEPWGCVLASYTQRRRLDPEEGGIMWIVGYPGDEREYQFSAGLDAPATIVLTDVPASIKNLTQTTNAKIVTKDGLQPEEYAALSYELTKEVGFDDIVVLEPQSAAAVSEIARHIARRGTLNMVGQTPLDGLTNADVGRLHYDYIAFLGNPGPDIATSYGEARNRCELQANGAAVFIGAGGPMGQMHVQRAIEMPNGPRLVVATEVSASRLKALRERFIPLAEEHGRELHVINPVDSDQSLYDFVMGLTDHQGVDDVVVSVPVAGLMAEAATLMNPNGMLVLFAGVPNGTLAPLDLSTVYLHNAQYTGTSGLTIHDQAAVLQRANEGALSPGRMVAAIGGMQAGLDAIDGVINSSYPGKIVIFPQIQDLPLMGLDELSEKLPEVAEKLGPGNVWTAEAEAVLIESHWQPAK
ncbi:MAG: zinc-binding dehydrogenase [Anaerolineae bacterium]|nr:zinc-binding dehydrogenase [Anaerolineae bacterium]